MDFAASKDDNYLMKYYAGQALVGLLSHGRLEKMDVVSEQRADELTRLAFDLADAKSMVLTP